MPVSHAFTSTKIDDADATIVRPTNWNENHVTNVDLATEVFGILPEANGGTGSATAPYIRLDGTTTTTASILFAEGVSVATTKKALFGGTSLPTARAGVYDDTTTFLIKGYQDSTQTNGANFIFQAGDGAVPDAPGGMFRLHGGNFGIGGDSNQNGFVTTDTAITSFGFSSAIGGASSIGNNIEDFYVGGACYVAGNLATANGIGTNGAILAGTGYALLAEGNTARIVGMDRRSIGPGLNLTIQAGWAQNTGTNQAAGVLKLAPGKSTGSGIGGVDIQAVGGFGSGTTDRTPFDVVQWRSATATFPVAYNFACSAGLSIGSKVSDLISFYNVTPIVQPLAATDLGTVLSSLGLRASGTAYPITTSGTTTLTGTNNINAINLKAGAAAGNTAHPGGVIFDFFADVNNSGTAETDLYTSTLAASTLNADGGKVTATYQGIFTGAAAATQQLKVYFGGTVIYDSGALSIGVATNNWTVNVACIRVNSSTVRCAVWVNSDFATLFPYSKYVEVTGLTLTNTQILKITGTAAGAGGASNQITAKLGYVEWKAPD